MKTLGDIFGVKIEKDMVKKRPMRVEDIDCSSRLEKYFKEHNGKLKHGNNEMREQFEKLPEIARMIESGDVWWSENHNNYSGSDSELDCYIDGAYYAFQEQQKKIDQLVDVINTGLKIEQSMNDQIRSLKNKIEILEPFAKELLK